MGIFLGNLEFEQLAANGFSLHFVQDNQNLLTQNGTIRSLYCQIAPSIQGKLVRVIRGSIWDVAMAS